MLAHLGAHMRQELEKVVGPPVADDPIDFASPQHQDDGWEHVHLPREARPLVARGGNIDEADRQLRCQGLLVARQHIATKELTIDAMAARPVAPPVRAQIATVANKQSRDRIEAALTNKRPADRQA
jgi:hypothetical protein